VATFGFIGEGITDQTIIEDILLGFATDHDLDEPELAPLQPPFDFAPGGWTLVFHYLARGEHRNALQTLDYLIIHVDTDVSHEKGFDVPHNDENGPLPVEKLVENVIGRLIALIGKETYEAHAHRFIFAVAVHSTECWLLPLVFDDNKTNKLTGCLDAINHELRALRNESPLSLADGTGKDPTIYRKHSRAYRKPKQLRKSHPKNPSFTLFIRHLEQRLAPPPPLSPPPEAAPPA